MKLKLSFFCLCCVLESLGDCRFLVIPARFYFGVPLWVTVAELLYGLIVTTRDADLQPSVPRFWNYLAAGFPLLNKLFFQTKSTSLSMVSDMVYRQPTFNTSATSLAFLSDASSLKCSPRLTLAEAVAMTPSGGFRIAAVDALFLKWPGLLFKL